MRNFNNIGRVKVFINDPNKKSFFKIIKEVFVIIKAKREIPFYYFKYLYRKEVKNYLDYLSTGEINAIGNSKLLHKPAYRSLLDNKLFFSLLLEKSSLHTPKLVSYNLGNSFHYNNTNRQIFGKAELIEFFENVFKANKLEGLFLRPLSDYGGKGCFKLTRNHLKKEIDAIIDLIFKGSYVHTKIIKQHEEIDKIHNRSVSTMRIISLITSSGQAEIIGAAMRFGVGSSVVDNASSGGFVVGVNVASGTLKRMGRYFLDYGGGEIYEHPDSGFKLEGFKIPYFKEACEEVLKGVTVIPDRFIGWDVAITPSGPTLVEANAAPHLPSFEIEFGGLLRNQHIKQLVAELKGQRV
ncbi:Sugar-transfer associated ATP-grasp [Pricia antarctica]|uniref:Sugar-transfer associated ATP-grasp n=1 Tax=Pricia antarctica TaxID=641691 RepID=A0A1G7DDH7_9FLAO|nr:sugar-transfer associated ATP-grasp domain-containing protein [Pricia antarctica]SDE49016.1 Sugar-transfer associated ATP-grasp [Pricia antarctica]